jgi:hypothetical protein
MRINFDEGKFSPDDFDEKLVSQHSFEGKSSEGIFKDQRGSVIRSKLSEKRSGGSGDG